MADKEVKETKEKSQLVQAVKAINNTYKEPVILKLGTNMQILDREYMPTGSVGLDLALGGGMVRGRIIELFGPESCQPAGSVVWLSDGTFKDIKDIKIGDRVFSPQKDGSISISTVLKINNYTPNELYEIVSCRTGNVLYRATADHIIPYEFSAHHERKGHINRGIRETTIDRLNKLAPSYIKDCSVFSNTAIKYFEVPPIKMDVCPYMVGLIIGDGHVSKNVLSLTNGNETVLRHARKEFVNFREYNGAGCKELRTTSKNKYYIWCVSNGLLNKCAGDKFIPKQLLTSNIETRLKLLSGLVDSDGHLIKHDGGLFKFDYVTKSLQLSKDIEFLVRSLGGHCSINIKTIKYKNKPREYYRLYISIDYNIKYSYKADNCNPTAIKKSCKTYSFYIRKGVVEEVYGFLLDSHSGWYITDNFIVTHNSGKTTLALQIAAQAQRFGSVVFVDSEHCFDPVYAANLGVDVNNLYMSQPACAEVIFEVIEAVVASGEVSLVILDSVASIASRAEVEGESGDSNMGTRAKLLSQHIRKVTPLAHKTKTTVLYVNQIRKLFGGTTWGSNEYTPGSDSLKYQASVRLDIRRIKTEGEKEDRTGIISRVRVVKNKTYVPFKECTFTIDFGLGINIYREVLDLAEKAGLIEKSGAWYSYNGERMGQGEQAAANYIKESGKIEEFIAKIKEKGGVK